MAYSGHLMPALCRDCGEFWSAAQTNAHVTSGPGNLTCPICRSSRVTSHNELTTLCIAHIDCDAFYAAVEKRDNPDIRGKPVIIGGERRGVVAAACYIARISGVRSAMPMFQARKLCPDAVIIKPNMAKYSAVGKEVRTLMEEATPLVEPLSIDEAFLDLSGTTALHGMSPAQTLVRLIQKIESEVGIAASVGLSFNKFLAKIASDIDKPRGFAIIGKDEAEEFLSEKPVSMIWGVGKALRAKLEGDGIRQIGQLRTFSESELAKRYGAMGQRLHTFCHARDDRHVNPISVPKTISTETTFNEDIAQPERLSNELWALSEKLSHRLKKAGFGGGTVNLKLKTADFRSITRARQLAMPTQLAEDIYNEANMLLLKEADGRKFRLIGVGVVKLVDARDADLPDLADPERDKRVRIESTIDGLRERFGAGTIKKGRGLKHGD